MCNNNYDSWERLVVAVLRREQDRQLALADSRESSISSSFNFGLDSPVHEQSLQLEASSSKVNERDREILFPSATSSSAGLSRFSAAASDDTYGSGEILPTSNLKAYTFADLKFATKNFKPDMILGVGSFGTVFKGWVDPNTLAPSKIGIGMMVVAIQKLNRESTIQFEEWQSEVNFLGRLSHPNLVKLHGYCWEDKGLLLVYEFMQRGSLEYHLFRGNIEFEPLSWDIRLKIAIGAARGLAFLHTLEKRVICGDFMASNILLDVNYNAKLSNFILPKFGGSASEEEENSPVSQIVETYGNGFGAPWDYYTPGYITTDECGCGHGAPCVYCAPEYFETAECQFDCHLYVKSDVYGFGVVLLEILTGLRAIDNNRPSDMKNLVDYAKPFLDQKRKLMRIMDNRMEGQYSSKAALKAAHLVLRCLQLEPKKRPSMKEVGETLEQIAAIGKPNKRIQK